MSHTSRNNRKLPAALFGLAAKVDWEIRPVEFTDTDPQMLHALWALDSGIDPERSLDEVAGAVVVYDKFRPGVSGRKVS